MIYIIHQSASIIINHHQSASFIINHHQSSSIQKIQQQRAIVQSAIFSGLNILNYFARLRVPLSLKIWRRSALQVHGETGPSIYPTLSDFLDDLDHILKRGAQLSTCATWSSWSSWSSCHATSEKTALHSSSIKGWSLPHLWGLCFTCRLVCSVRERPLQPFYFWCATGHPYLSENIFDLSGSKARSCFSVDPAILSMGNWVYWVSWVRCFFQNRQGPRTFPTPEQPWTWGQASLLELNGAQWESLAMKDLWPRLSQQRLVNSKTEVLELSVKMKAWPRSILQSFSWFCCKDQQITWTVQKVLNLILLCREDHWSLANDLHWKMAGFQNIAFAMQQGPRCSQGFDRKSNVGLLLDLVGKCYNVGNPICRLKRLIYLHIISTRPSRFHSWCAQMGTWCGTSHQSMDCEVYLLIHSSTNIHISSWATSLCNNV